MVKWLKKFSCLSFILALLLSGCSPFDSEEQERIDAWLEAIERIDLAFSGDKEAIIELLACIEEDPNPSKTWAEYYWLLRLQKEGVEIDMVKLEAVKNANGPYINAFIENWLETEDFPYIANSCLPDTLPTEDYPEETEEEKSIKEYYLALDKANETKDDFEAFYQVVLRARKLKSCEANSNCLSQNFISNIYLFEAANGGHPQAIQDILMCLETIESYPEKPRALLYWAEMAKDAGLSVTEEDISNYRKNLNDNREDLDKLDYINASVVGPYDWMVIDPDYPC